MNILAVDVGGTHVKVLASDQAEPRRFRSGPGLTPARMVAKVQALAAGWSFGAVSIGYPGPVVHGRIAAEPANLGRGWVGFDFAGAFGLPVRLINDAAMQALGSYEGGRMLFLGLGTGLGSAMIVDGRLEPMELAHLPYRKGRSYEDYLGVAGLKRLGPSRWRKHVLAVVELLSAALEPDRVVIGGGNAARLGVPPPGVRLGTNANAFLGGFRLWPESGAPGAGSLAGGGQDGSDPGDAALAIRERPAQRVSVTTRRPFAEVLARLDAALGHPDPPALRAALSGAPGYRELEEVVRGLAGPSGLMEFARFDLGEVLRKEPALKAGQSLRLLVGNPLVMRRMVERVADAGSYAPVTLLVDERPGGVCLSYDPMASMLASSREPEALATARELDGKVEALMREAADAPPPPAPGLP